MKKGPDFSSMPVMAIHKFLECYDQGDLGAKNVPPHILDELALCFRQFMYGNSVTLNDAFGGSTVRQRRKIKLHLRDLAICHSVHLHRFQKLNGTGSLEQALLSVAEEIADGPSDDKVELVRKAWANFGLQLYPALTRAKQPSCK